MHKLEVLDSFRTDHEYLDYLRSKVLPLVLLVHSEVCDKWRKKAQECDRIESKVISEIKVIYSELKKRIVEVGLHDNSAIKKCMCRVESMFTFKPKKGDAYEIEDHKRSSIFICKICGDGKESHRISLFLSYSRGLFEQVKCLCYTVFDLGREGILHDFVEIKEFSQVVEDVGTPQRYYCMECKYMYSIEKIDVKSDDIISPCPKCSYGSNFVLAEQKSIIRKVRVIDRFIFAPEVFTLIDLESVSIGQGMQAWMAWNVFDSLYWIELEKTQDVLRKKVNSLYYNNLKACHKSIKLPQQYIINKQIQAIENKRQGSRKNPYNRGSLGICLNIVLHDGFGDDFFKLDSNIYPCAIELVMDYEELYWYVGWGSDTIQVLYVRFSEKIDSHGNDCENKIHSFVKNLYYNFGMCFDLDYLLKTKVNARKYLQRRVFKGILFDLFIEEKSGSIIVLKFKSTVLEGMAESKLKKIRAILDEFETKWWIVDSVKIEIDKGVLKVS